MAFGDKKAEAAALIGRLQAEVDHLKEENTWLRKKIDGLQEALIAKESPIAYHQMKMDEAAAEYDAQEKPPKDIESRVKELNVLTQLTYEAEQPLFKDPDDLISALNRQIGAPVSESIHGNEES